MFSEKETAVTKAKSIFNLLDVNGDGESKWMKTKTWILSWLDGRQCQTQPDNF